MQGVGPHVVNEGCAVARLDEEVVSQAWMCVVMTNGCSESSRQSAGYPPP